MVRVVVEVGNGYETAVLADVRHVTVRLREEFLAKNVGRAVGNHAVTFLYAVRDRRAHAVMHNIHCQVARTEQVHSEAKASTSSEREGRERASEIERERNHKSNPPSRRSAVHHHARAPPWAGD